jgi:hypothetical protein
MDKPIKVLFEDEITSEVLSDNSIVFSRPLSNNTSLGLLIVTDEEYEYIKQHCDELDIEIEE